MRKRITDPWRKIYRTNATTVNAMRAVTAGSCLCAKSSGDLTGGELELKSESVTVNWPAIFLNSNCPAFTETDSNELMREETVALQVSLLVENVAAKHAFSNVKSFSEKTA